MISYNRDPQQQIPASSVKIIGLGGAGANMLERIALEGIDGTELLALNTDIRTLTASFAKDKIQLGKNLTKGLGTGGDPELGQQAVLESEQNIREVLKGQRIVFLCVGLGGGTGSGAAPIIARIAREEGAFVVVFATMPFFFEGRRRQEQAETSLNQLAVLSNALVTFDNNRMGELVLAKQGIHEAFVAADRMISESIKAVIRLVVRPGIIKIGLDELMSALRTNRSRCLFGSGIASGKDRASKALSNALSSPLLDQGSLLKDAQTVLVHLSGGESLTLFEIELLMQSLQKFVPENAQVLFGAAIDPSMDDKLSITLISALPEDALIVRGVSPSPVSKVEITPAKKNIESPFKEELVSTSIKQESSESITKDLFSENLPIPIEAPISESNEPITVTSWVTAEPLLEPIPESTTQSSETPPQPEHLAADTTSLPTSPFTIVAEESENQSLKQSDLTGTGATSPLEDLPKPIAEVEKLPSTDLIQEKVDSAPTLENTPIDPIPAKRKLWGKSEPEIEKSSQANATAINNQPQKPELKLNSKTHSEEQNELAFDSAPKGRFEGESPNVLDGEDLDLPPFLRKKRP